MKKIVTFVILCIVCFSGCIDIFAGSVSIDDLIQNPEEYLNKTITIKGDKYANTLTDSSGNILLVKYDLSFDYRNMVYSGTYYFTGIFQYGTYEENLTTYYLKITDIEPL